MPDPTRTTRRVFLKLAAAGAASTAILAACAPAPTPTPVPAPKPVAAPTQAPAKPAAAAPTPTPAPKPAAPTPTTAAAPKPTPPPAPTAAAAPSKEAITVRVMHRGGKVQIDEVNDVFAIVDKKYGGKWQGKLDFVELGAGVNYNSKLLALIAAGSLSDVFYMNAEVLPSFAVRGAFYDLTPLDKADGGSKDYWPELVEMSRFKGKLHGLPKDYSPYVIWVNQTRFKEAGVELPKPGWTWGDLLEKAAALTKREGNRITHYGVYGYSWFTAVWQNGGDFFNADYTKATLDTPQAVEAIQWVADHNLKHKVAPVGNDISASGQNVYQWFGTGRIAMYFMGRWAVMDLRPLKNVEWDAYPLPKGKVEANVYLQSGPTVASTTKYPEAAWEFTKVWTGVEMQLKGNVASGVSIPTVNSPAIREAYLNATPPSKQGNQVFYDAIKVGHPLPTTGTFSWLEVSQIAAPEFDLVFQGKQSAADAVKKVNPKLQELADKKA